ncbi:MAG TPA: DUF6457 domain-containing protein [Mycobacteriales bacterium]|nr:DUF6457 domain-containing protein [Mycobacteriales bacterium]
MTGMSTVDDWVAAVRDALGLSDEVDVTLVLDLAREAAHAVARPAAPVTTYLLGLAVARGADPEQATALLTELAREFPPP